MSLSTWILASPRSVPPAVRGWRLLQEERHRRPSPDRARTLIYGKLPEPGDPDLPAIEPKIQNADDYPQNEQRTQDEDGNRECRIEIRSEDGCMHLLNLPQRQLAMGLMDIRRFWGPRIVLLPEDCAKNHSCRHGRLLRLGRAAR